MNYDVDFFHSRRQCGSYLFSFLIVQFILHDCTESDTGLRTCNIAIIGHSFYRMSVISVLRYQRDISKYCFGILLTFHGIALNVMMCGIRHPPCPPSYKLKLNLYLKL